MPALTAVTNGQVSDATHVNQFRDLFRGGFVHDVKNGYGAVGDGVTDDTAAFETAKDAAGPWAEVYVPVGTYVIGDFQFDAVGQHWTFARGAIIYKKSGVALGTAIEATDVVLDGGEWDGNFAGSIVASGIIFQATAVRSIVRNMRIHNTRNAGVYNTGANFVKVQDCEIWSTEVQPIFMDNTADGCEISGNYIHDVPSGYIGINIHGTDPSYSRRPRIVNNYVEPGQLTGICIEVWGLVPGAVISGNQTVGGLMGVSVAASDHTVVSGNHIQGPAYSGVEIAGSQFCAVTGNTIVGIGTTDGGIFLAAASIPNRFHEITGNTIYNTEVAINVYQSDHVNIGPNLLHTFNPAGIWFNASHHGTVTGVTFYNPSVAADGVLFDNSNHGIVSGCDFENMSVGVGCTASGTDNIRVIGNRFTTTTFKYDNFAGANRKGALNDPTTGDTVTL